MAAAFAERRWPTCVVRSAGISVNSKNVRAADAAIEVMKSLEIDISAHKPTSIANVPVADFEFVVALEKRVRDALIGQGVDPARIVNLFVDDPYGSDISQYLRCANAITKGLAELSFDRNHAS